MRSSNSFTRHHITSSRILPMLFILMVACSPAPAPVHPAAPPTVDPTDSDAVLEARISDVFYRPPGTIEILVNQGVRRNAKQGDGVNVNTGGEALLSFRDYLQVRIFRDSNLNIDSQIDPNAPPVAVVRLQSGTTFNTASSQALAGQRVQVATEWATIVATGTEFLVHYELKSQQTWVVVKTGTVQVTASGVTVIVQARWQTWVQPRLPPEPPVPASRIAVGNQFPFVDALTNGALSDQDLLGDPRAQCAPYQQSNLRTQPDARAEPLAVIPAGAPFVPLSRIRLANGEIWLSGSDSKGVQGWILSAAVTCGFDVSVLAEKNAPPPPTPTRTSTPTFTPTRTNTPTVTMTATRTPTAYLPMNLALKKLAAQSSTAFGGVASRAVDGITDGIFANNSVTHTGNDSQAWWRVDLGAVHSIDNVKIFNRTDDCCRDRLSAFNVLVFNDIKDLDTKGLPGVSAYYTAEKAGILTTVSVKRTGRYVRVQLSGTNYLSLAEVQVWGQ